MLLDGLDGFLHDPAVSFLLLGWLLVDNGSVVFFGRLLLLGLLGLFLLLLFLFGWLGGDDGERTIGIFV